MFANISLKRSPPKALNSLIFFSLSRWKTHEKNTPFLRLARGLDINTTQETNTYQFEL